MSIVGAGGGLLLLMFLAIIWWKRSKRKLISKYSINDDDDDDNDNDFIGIIGDDVQLLDLANNNSKNSNNEYFDPQMTLDRKSVTLDKVIGEGNFGKVFSGTAKDPQRGNAVVPVAVKSPSAGARIEFEVEMEIMAQLTRFGGHQHIVSVVGCVYGKAPLLVLELCAGGSLKTALTASRKAALAQGTSSAVASPTSATATVFAVAELTTFGHQTALAMSFLERHKLLHRDLAARNVLLTEQRPMVCKLADFGLSRTVGAEKEYYRRTTGTSAPIPVRWMAPETLDDSVSTINSDKWSFGVLLWEIFSLGLRPYIGVENHEIAKHIRKGHRLDQPDACPDEIYSGVMEQCWEMNPAARPAFDTISERLHSLSAATHV